MSLRILRLGSPRRPNEGPRLGTARFPPRGVAKAEIAKRDFYDLWFPLLAPSAELIKRFRDSDDPRAWAAFARAFRSEMKRPEAARVLDLLALLSHTSDFSLGCYCAEENRCHRSVLRELLQERGAKIADA